MEAATGSADRNGGYLGNPHFLFPIHTESILLFRFFEPPRHGDTEGLVLLADREMSIGQSRHSVTRPSGRVLLEPRRRRRGGFDVPYSPGALKAYCPLCLERDGSFTLGK
jgi:hypothetical protein